MKLKQKRIINSINYAKNPEVSYGGTKYQYGYHTLDLSGLVLKGQRDNYERLNMMSSSYTFDGKIVMDVGCGPGGILHTLSDKILYGVGIDNNYKQINIANMVKHINSENNISFYVFDLEKEPLSHIEDFLDGYTKVDVCLFLSMAKWIPNWRDIVKYCQSISNSMIYESNGKQQDVQEAFLKKTYSSVHMISPSSPDDPLQKNRRLFICG